MTEDLSARGRLAFGVDTTYLRRRGGGNRQVESRLARIREPTRPGIGPIGKHAAGLGGLL